jgi:hypothetical protein
MEIKQWFRKMSFDTAEKVVAKKAKITNTTFTFPTRKKTASQKTNKQFSSKKLYLLTLQLIISKQ